MSDVGLAVHCVCPQGVATDLISDGFGSAAVATVRSQRIITPDEVATALETAVDEGRFLVLPHAEVADDMKVKAAEPDRWLAGMRKLQARILGSLG